MWLDYERLWRVATGFESCSMGFRASNAAYAQENVSQDVQSAASVPLCTGGGRFFGGGLGVAFRSLEEPFASI